MKRLGLLASIALSATMLAVPPATEATSSANLSLVVSFFANGTISVTLPDGSALGATSGAPQVIPAGFYTLLFSGPGGCTSLPYFHLTGPGTNIVTNMAEGETQKTTNTANLLPSSTYVWSDDAFPGVMHTFATSAVVEGSPPSGSVDDGNGGQGQSSYLSGRRRLRHRPLPRDAHRRGERRRQAQSCLQGKKRREAQSGQVHDQSQ